MRVDRLGVAFRLGFRELLRRRIVLLLLLLIPSIFYLVVVLTTTEADIVFRLASIERATFVPVAQRHVGAVFMGLASVGGIIGPTVAGWAYDTMGSYQWVWPAFVVVQMVSVGLSLKIKSTATMVSKENSEPCDA